MSYIGYTSIARRHKRYIEERDKPPPKMAGDVLKYKPYETHFIQEIIAICVTKVLAIFKEAEMIELHNTLWPKGYNTLAAHAPYTDRFWSWSQSNKYTGRHV
jgi:hypothetical protein